MKICKSFWWFCLTILISFTIASAKELRQLVAKDIMADSYVLEVQWPQEMEGKTYFIGWAYPFSKTQKNVPIYGFDQIAREGRNLVDLRPHPQWKGAIKALGLSTFSPHAQLIKPTLADEWTIFMTPEALKGSTSNYLQGHTLFAWEWTIWVWGFLIIMLPLIRYTFKKNWWVSLVLAFGISLFISDLRMAFDHFHVTQVDGVHQKMAESVKEVSKVISEQLNEKTWSMKSVRIPWNFHLQYRLAEFPHISEKNYRNADFIITESSDNEFYLDFNVLKTTQ